MAELLVDPGAICRNYTFFTRYGRVIPVLKENAYGLGAEAVRTLLHDRADVRLFACSRAEEAMSLAAADSDLMLLAPEYDAEALRALAEKHVILTVESLSQAQLIQSLGIPVRVQLAVDTGLGRFGFSSEDTDAMRAVFSLDKLTVFGVFSHLAVKGKETQLARFQKTLAALSGLPLGMRHIASTYSAELPGFALDAVRVGSGLTGRMTGLENAAVLTGKICSVRHMKKGSRVSYSGVRLKRDSDVAVVDIGTGDGAFTYRACGVRTWLASRHKTVHLENGDAPVIGFPGLTHTSIDVTGIPCAPGARVTVDQSPVMIPANVPRRYLDIMQNSSL